MDITQDNTGVGMAASIVLYGRENDLDQQHLSPGDFDEYHEWAGEHGLDLRANYLGTFEDMLTRLDAIGEEEVKAYLEYEGLDDAAERLEMEGMDKEKDIVEKPFGGYETFDSCVSSNSDKEDPEAYCAQIHYNATGEWPAEKATPEGIPDDAEYFEPDEEIPARYTEMEGPQGAKYGVESVPGDEVADGEDGESQEQVSPSDPESLDAAPEYEDMSIEDVDTFSTLKGVMRETFDLDHTEEFGLQRRVQETAMKTGLTESEISSEVLEFVRGEVGTFSDPEADYEDIKDSLFEGLNKLEEEAMEAYEGDDTYGPLREQGKELLEEKEIVDEMTSQELSKFIATTEDTDTLLELYGQMENHFVNYKTPARELKEKLQFEKTVPVKEMTEQRERDVYEGTGQTLNELGISQSDINDWENWMAQGAEGQAAEQIAQVSTEDLITIAEEAENTADKAVETALYLRDPDEYDTAEPHELVEYSGSVNDAQKRLVGESVDEVIESMGDQREILETVGSLREVRAAPMQGTKRGAYSSNVVKEKMNEDEPFNSETLVHEIGHHIEEKLLGIEFTSYQEYENTSWRSINREDALWGYSEKADGKQVYDDLKERWEKYRDGETGELRNYQRRGGTEHVAVTFRHWVRDTEKLKRTDPGMFMFWEKNIGGGEGITQDDPSREGDELIVEDVPAVDVELKDMVERRWTEAEIKDAEDMSRDAKFAYEQNQEVFDSISDMEGAFVAPLQDLDTPIMLITEQSQTEHGMWQNTETHQLNVGIEELNEIIQPEHKIEGEQSLRVTEAEDGEIQSVKTRQMGGPVDEIDVDNIKGNIKDGMIEGVRNE